jgi:hypothetical protein
MFKKALVSAAIGALVAAVSLGAGTVAAEAHSPHHHDWDGGPPPYRQNGGPSFWFGFGNGWGGWNNGWYGYNNWAFNRPPGRQVCEPAYQWQWAWTPHGWSWQQVYVGQNCHWVGW